MGVLKTPNKKMIGAMTRARNLICLSWKMNPKTNNDSRGTSLEFVNHTTGISCDWPGSCFQRYNL
jgi:hypothetical protein